jgi:DNA-binding response OmpR family regulator
MTSRTPNILLLDQDDVLRRATEILLSHRGADVSAAATLDEAIALAQQRSYDVALIDVSPAMPAARELVGRLRGGGSTPERVVLCVDAPVDDVEHAERVEREELGEGTEVLLKPYAFDRLISAVLGRPARPAERPAARRRLTRQTQQRTGPRAGTRRRPADRVLRSSPGVARGRRRPG